MRCRVSLVVLALAATEPTARAAILVTIDPAFARQTGLSPEVVATQISEELDRLFQVYRVKDYVRSFGDAQAFTTRGLGVDYGSVVRFVEVGFAANVAMNGNQALFEKDPQTQPIGGLAPNLTAMAGISLDAIGVPITIFGNYFKSKATLNDVAVKLDNFGVHAQLKLLGPRRETAWSALVRWGGIDITSGLDHGHMQLSLGRDFSREVPITDAQHQKLAQVDVAAAGRFVMDATTWSIPLELTTNLRFLYVLSAYGGVGFDWQVAGGSQMQVDLSSTLTGTVPSQTGSIPVGTASILATESADPSTGRIRGLVGLQANLFLLKIFVQLNAIPSPFLASIAFGARLVW
jgi:hypothetical protein